MREKTINLYEKFENKLRDVVYVLLLFVFFHVIFLFVGGKKEFSTKNKEGCKISTKKLESILVRPSAYFSNFHINQLFFLLYSILLLDIALVCTLLLRVYLGVVFKT